MRQSGSIIFAEVAIWIAGHTNLADFVGRMFDKICASVTTKAENTQ